MLNFLVVCPFSLSFFQSLFWIPKEHFGFYVCGLAKTYKAYPGEMTGLSRQCLHKDPTRRKSSMYKWEKRKWVLLKQTNPLSFDRPKRIYTNIPLPFLVMAPKRGEKMSCVCVRKKEAQLSNSTDMRFTKKKKQSKPHSCAQPIL